MAHGFGKMRRVEQSSCSEGVRRCNEAAEVRLRGAAVRMVDERKIWLRVPAARRSRFTSWRDRGADAPTTRTAFATVAPSLGI
jgi:hypothetical protein